MLPAGHLPRRPLPGRMENDLVETPTLLPAGTLNDLEYEFGVINLEEPPLGDGALNELAESPDETERHGRPSGTVLPPLGLLRAFIPSMLLE